MQVFILEYYKLYQFQFLGKIDGTCLNGKFVLDEETMQKFKRINEFKENEEEQGRIWYLDEDGKASFSLDSWFRIGDEYNARKQMKCLLCLQ